LRYFSKLCIFERKILRRIFCLISKRGQWWKGYDRELEELYKEPNKVNRIKSSRQRWADHVLGTDDDDFKRVEEFKYLGTTSTNQNSIAEEIKSR